MSTVTSKDGTKIAFDKVGSGPAIILINGAMSYRAFDPFLAQLAELLSPHFTVYNFDRRGRGESGNTQPFTKQREIEDVQALIEDAGGKAMLFGISSGGAVALETAAVTPGVSKVFVYEVPFIVDDSRQSLPDYAERSARLAAEGKLDELLEYFITVVAGMPAEFVVGMKQDEAMWGGMRAIAPTIAHDAAFMGPFMQGKPLPAGQWATLTMPVMAADGGASDAWFHHAADALADILPDASRATLEGQSHMIDPNVLAPVMIEFLKRQSEVGEEHIMRKIVVTEFVSLDGVMENPSWTFPYWNEEVAAFKNEERDASDALLLGRVTYQEFAGAWPKVKPEKDDFAPFMNGVRKYVVSTTLTVPLEWNNSVLITGDLVEEVNKIKQQEGLDIAVHGSAALAQSLMQHNLVDSYRLLVYPVVVGKGKRLFKEGIPATLKLVESRTMSSGVVALVYEPASSR